MILDSILSSLFGIQKTASESVPKERYPAVVLGGGVGGLTAALYLARARQSDAAPVLVVEGVSPGGLLTQTNNVKNWPGEMEISGAALTDKIRAQVLANGGHLLREEIVAVDLSRRPFTVTTRAPGSESKIRTIRASSCIIAMGTTPNQQLKAAGEVQYWGKGISKSLANCATCDRSLYKGKIVGVIGGGDAAVLESMHLSNLAKKVHLFVRGTHLKATDGKRISALLKRPNIEIHYTISVEEMKGNGNRLTGVVLKNGLQQIQNMALDSLLLAIGSSPNSQLFRGLLQLDARGYIVLKNHQETSIPGVYGVGDITSIDKPEFKQALLAAGDGAKAALQAQEFLTLGN